MSKKLIKKELKLPLVQHRAITNRFALIEELFKYLPIGASLTPLRELTLDENLPLGLGELIIVLMSIGPSYRGFEILKALESNINSAPFITAIF